MTDIELVPTNEVEIYKFFPNVMEMSESFNWGPAVWILHYGEEEELYEQGIDGVQWDGCFLTLTENFGKRSVDLTSDYFMGPGSAMREGSVLREVGPFTILEGKVILED